MVFWSWLFAVFLLFAGEKSVANPHFVTRFWSRENGLAENKVSAVLQSQDGYLWVGTYNGLARFDGVRFMNFDSGNTPEMADSVVTSLFEDKEGALWIGHETGEVTLFDHGKFRPAETAARWARKKILGIGADEEGDIWFCNEDGLLARARDGTVLSPESGWRTNLVEFTRSSRGAIWINRAGRVSRLQRGTLAPLDFTAGDTNTSVEAVGASGDGGVWVLADDRLRKWKAGWTEDLGATPAGEAPFIKLVECAKGTLLGATSDQGLFLIFPDRKCLQFSRSTGFTADWVMDAQQDREGNIWAGTGGGGLAMIRESNIETPVPPDAWQGRAVLSVGFDRDAALWVGTEGAGLYRFQNGIWTNFNSTAGLGNVYIWSLAQDISGDLWAGSWSGGLFVRRGDHFENAPGLEHFLTPMPALCASRDGGLWIGTTEGLLRYEHGRKTWFGQDAGPARRDVRCILEDHLGDVWFGTAGEGLFQLKNGALEQFGRKDGLSSDFIRCLREDGTNGLWIGTSGGLVRLRENRFSVICEQQGLPHNVICDIEDDGHGYFWMSSYSGIFQVSQSELRQCADGKIPAVHCLSLSAGDGLPSLEATGAGCRSADGKLWFPTCRGLVAIDPQGARTNMLVPPVIIEGVFVDNQRLANLSGDLPVQIPPGNHRFQFEYTGLSFAAPEKVRFRYRLDPLNPDWTDAGGRRMADFPYIPPGDYTFRVMACNNDGVWNEEGASLAVTVLPHFWQTAWFRVSGALMTILAASAVAWFETRRRMRRKLEILERQRAVERERTRIAKDIHDDLGASLTRINLLSQSTRRSLDNHPQTERNLDQICTTARQLTRSMDEIVWAVDPQHDTLESLAGYLAKLIHEVLRDSGIRCRLDFPLQLPEWPLTAEMRHNLFLAFKEALHNIVKHSGASEVQVAFVSEAAAFTLKVADNGCGFDAAAASEPALVNGELVPRRNGLINMRQRLEEIGGSCEIQSERGGGTQVVFFLPVPVLAK
jgi:signal transduction histidine kinase/ligand-binding sensor domain-containing protein